MAVLGEVADGIKDALVGQRDWGLSGAVAGQYRHDVVADEVAVRVLDGAGWGILSEESGLHHPERALLAVVDPIDGSTNASRRLPWWATSVCVLDEAGPWVALVVNQATGTRYAAVRGKGASRDGQAIRPSRATVLSSSIVALNGYAPVHYGWEQYRAYGAAALDLCAVADGTFDAFVDCAARGLAPWDYLGGLLVCSEAGAPVAELDGRDLVVRDVRQRRRLVAAATAELLDAVTASWTTSLPPVSEP